MVATSPLEAAASTSDTFNMSMIEWVPSSPLICNACSGDLGFRFRLRL
jgi:hypothetical protein